MVKRILSLIALCAFLVLNLCSFTTSTQPKVARGNYVLDSLCLPLMTPSIPDETYYLNIADPRTLPLDADSYSDWSDVGRFQTTYEFPLYNGVSMRLSGEQYCSTANPVAYTDLIIGSGDYSFDSRSAGIVLNLSAQAFGVPFESITGTNYNQRMYIGLYDGPNMISPTEYVQYADIHVSGNFHYTNNVTGEVTTRTLTNVVLEPSGGGTYAPSTNAYTIAFETYRMLDWLDLPSNYSLYVTDLSIRLPISDRWNISRIRFVDPITPQSAIDERLTNAMRNEVSDPNVLDFGWIVDSTIGVFSLELLPSISLFDIVATGVGLALFIFILKRFAGG